LRCSRRRSSALQGTNERSGQPDFREPLSGNPDTYEALRTASFLYVECHDHSHECYDLETDPFELHNVFDTLPALRRSVLHRELATAKRCHGGPSCWAALQVAPAP